MVAVAQSEADPRHAFLIVRGDVLQRDRKLALTDQVSEQSLVVDCDPIWPLAPCSAQRHRERAEGADDRGLARVVGASKDVDILERNAVPCEAFVVLERYASYAYGPAGSRH